MLELFNSKQGQNYLDFFLLISWVGSKPSVLVATSARDKCRALVCSCYAPSRSSFDEQTTTANRDGVDYNNIIKNNGCGRGGSRQPQTQTLTQRRNGGRSSTAVSNEPCRLKSNLKKTAAAAAADEDENSVRIGSEQRKVNWPDAIGKDIAHVQEFEPSSSEDGEQAGTRNPCVCTIQ